MDTNCVNPVNSAGNMDLLYHIEAEITRLMLLQKNGIIEDVDTVVDDLKRKEFAYKEKGRYCLIALEIYQKQNSSIC